MEDFLNFKDSGTLDGKKPILISGVYRSGTTFLTAVINNHPNIAAAASTVKYLRFCLPHFDLNQPDALDDLLTETSARILTRWGLELNIHEIKETLEDNPVSHAAVYDAIMNSLLVKTKSGAKRWAEKINLQWRDIPKFLEMYPDGQVVHIFRDPRDVSSSYKNMTYEPWPAFLDAALNCKAAMMDLPIYQHQYGHHRLLTLKAEDLASNPHTEIKRIFDFLGEPFNVNLTRTEEYGDIKGEDWRENTSFGRNEKNYVKASNRWKTTLTREECFLVEMLCQPEMAKLNYEGSSQSVDKLDMSELKKIFLDPWLSGRISKYLSSGVPEQGYRSDPYETEMKIVFGAK